MQVDVVEAQCAVLQEHISRAGDFEDAESAHSAFLSALLDKTLLSSPRVAKALKTIYQLCTRLCSLVQVLSAFTPGVVVILPVSDCHLVELAQHMNA